MDDALLTELTNPYARRELAAKDRCDRCTARAAVVTNHQAGELMWCIHHFNRYKHHLGGLMVHDERVR